MHPKGDEVFAVRPLTRFYLISGLHDGAVQVTGYTKTGDAWTHHEVTPERAAEWLCVPPLDRLKLTGREATHFVVVDVQTRTLYTADKQDVASWTWALLQMLRGAPGPSTRTVN